MAFGLILGEVIYGEPLSPSTMAPLAGVASWTLHMLLNESLCWPTGLSAAHGTSRLLAIAGHWSDTQKVTFTGVGLMTYAGPAVPGHVAGCHGRAAVMQSALQHRLVVLGWLCTLLRRACVVERLLSRSDSCSYVGVLRGCATVAVLTAVAVLLPLLLHNMAVRICLADIGWQKPTICSVP